MSRLAKPLAPWTIYRFNLTMTMSLLHRITGVGLSLVVWVGILMWSEVFPPSWMTFIQQWKHVLIGSVVWGVCYHMLNGVRHLIWDKGLLMEPKTLVWSGITVWIGSLFATWGVIHYVVSL